MPRAFAAFALLLTPCLAAAEPPRVATDIAPIHGLAARVMAGLGTPDLIVPPTASPHGYAMRPSEAAALSRADFVFWVGAGLSPWLERPIARLASDAVPVALLDLPETETLPFREGARFAHDHDHEEHGHDDHGDAEHDDDEHGHAEHGDDDHAHADHGDDDHAHAGHGDDDHAHDAHTDDDHGHSHHGQTDPHAWLSPANAKLWLGVIAAKLAGADPENAARYHANAAAGRAEIDAAVAAAETRIDPVKGRPFVVFHDAYHYFEHEFGIPATAAIAIGDAASPGAARLAEVRETVREIGAVCVFREPQFEPGLAETVAEGTGARVAVLDPHGSDIPLGPEFYPALIRVLADALAGCLDGA